MTTLKKRYAQKKFQNVGRGQTAEISLSTDVTHVKSLIKITLDGVAATKAQTKAIMTSVEARLDGKQQFNMSAARLIELFEETGGTWVDGFLEVPYAQMHRTTSLGEDKTMWGMEDINDFDLYVTTTAGAEVLGLECVEVYRDVVQSSGYISTYREKTEQITGAGKYPFTIPYTPYTNAEGKTAYRVIPSVRLSGANITRVTVKQGNRKPYIDDLSVDDINYEYKQRQYVPQANIVTLSPELDTSREGEFWAPHVEGNVLYRELELEVETDGAGNITVLTEDRGPRVR